VGTERVGMEGVRTEGVGMEWVRSGYGTHAQRWGRLGAALGLGLVVVTEEEG
jgi:hypothetical protein